jgi:diacylglycerol kinase (ATP)
VNTTNNPLLRLIKATGYSFTGLRTTFSNEPAFRQELLVLLLVIPLAFWFGENGVDYALLIGCWLIVIMVELLNTAIEAVVNRIGTDHTELAGRAKDCGSAAVFIAIILSVIVWLLVLAL